MSVTLMKRILQAASPGDATATLVLLAIADAVNHKRGDNVSWLSVAEIAQRARLEKRQTRGVITALIDAGHLTAIGSRKGGRGATTRLRIEVDTLSPRHSADAEKEAPECRVSPSKRRQSGVEKEAMQRQKGGNAASKRRQPSASEQAVTSSNQQEQETRAPAREAAAPTRSRRRAPKPVAALPVYLPEEVFQEYREATKAKFPKWTPRDQHDFNTDLERLRNEGHDPIAVVQQSTEKQWKRLYAVNGENTAREPRRASSRASLDAHLGVITNVITHEASSAAPSDAHVVDTEAVRVADAH